MASLNIQSVDNVIHDIKAELKDVRDSKGETGTIIPFDNRKRVADDTIKLQIRNQKGQVFAVVLCASFISPELVATGIDKAAQIRAMLRPDLAKVILNPLMKGEFNGLTYVVLPYHNPISDSRARRFLQRRHLRPRILNWLREVTLTTKTEPEPNEIQSGFLRPLQQVIDNQKMSAQIRLAAEMSLTRLETKQWHPHFVMAHNDFWEGNLLLRRGQDDKKYGFKIIDWPGAEIKGHGIYDLLRMAMSLRLTSHQLLDELQKHCRILDCSMADSKGYLLASLGFLGMHLGYFPMERYTQLAEDCFQLLWSLDS